MVAHDLPAPDVTHPALVTPDAITGAKPRPRLRGSAGIILGAAAAVFVLVFVLGSALSVAIVASVLVLISLSLAEFII